MSNSLDEFSQRDIYVDTMVFYVFLRPDERVRSVIKGFFERFETGKIRAYTPH